MNLGLKGKIVVVTGAAGLKGSIGETIVHALANEGAIPVIVCRNDRGYKYEKKLQNKGGDATFIKTDLSNTNQIKNQSSSQDAKPNQKLCDGFEKKTVVIS